MALSVTNRNDEYVSSRGRHNLEAGLARINVGGTGNNVGDTFPGLDVGQGHLLVGCGDDDRTAGKFVDS